MSLPSEGAPRDPHLNPPSGTFSIAGDEHFTALNELLDRVSMDSTQLFDHCLNLLVAQLRAQRALMTRLTELGFEPFWWAHDPEVTMGGALEADCGGLSARVLDHPRRALVIRNTAEDPQWSQDPGCRRLGIGAFIGTALKESGQATGVLSVHFARPRAFTKGELALVNAVANLLGKTLEVESLRAELRMTKDALDLTSAVVEDSALQSAATGLPNARYLDVWLKANLYMARRKGEGMAVLVWKLLKSDDAKGLQGLMNALRGEDLLVDFGRGGLILALLPRTEMGGVFAMMERLEPWLGKRHIGATLWSPKLDDPQLQRALARAQEALRSAEGGPGLYWNLLPEA
ncbi:MAG TPA: GAF domain-containing protein [Holophagaceae bacterium]|nr:GAF domain-containing protein [Holophagaceae bacterium]